MVLTFAVSDKTGLVRGTVNIKLDWGPRQWSIESDPSAVMQKLGFPPRGSFESRPIVIWLKADATTTIIIWDPPKSETDGAHVSGKARIFEPKDAAFKDAIIDWKIAQSAQTAAAAAAPAGLSAARTKVRDQILKEVLDCVFPDKFLENGKLTSNPPKGSYEAKYILNPYNPWRRGAGTTCYTLPAYVALKLNRKFTAPVTTGLPKEGKRYKAWVYAKDSPTRPQTGDLYALCTGDLQDDNISHVGVILESKGTTWLTADTGQGDGYAGIYGVSRAYNEKTNALEGETRDGKKQRPIYGWVDLDLLVK